VSLPTIYVIVCTDGRVHGIAEDGRGETIVSGLREWTNVRAQNFDANWAAGAGSAYRWCGGAPHRVVEYAAKETR
jgi:hypothetical protein